MVRAPHIEYVLMTSPNPTNPPRPWWSSDAEGRAIDMYFDWEFYTTAEERSLDRMHEMHLREVAATRAIMKRGWAKTETDPGKKAELISLGNLSEGLGRSAHRREVEARPKRPTRKRRRS
jgi:hypothetical protein